MSIPFFSPVRSKRLLNSRELLKNKGEAEVMLTAHRAELAGCAPSHHPGSSPLNSIFFPIKEDTIR